MSMDVRKTNEKRTQTFFGKHNYLIFFTLKSSVFFVVALSTSAGCEFNKAIASRDRPTKQSDAAARSRFYQHRKKRNEAALSV